MITQIGSLPHKNIEDAIAYSLRHEIPFLPELSKQGDFMLEYIKNPGKLSCLKEFKKHKYKKVKIQCVGPATLMQNDYSEDEAVTRIYEHIEKILKGLNAKEIILFLDEPVLGQVGFDYKELWAPLFESFDVIPGVHTCDNMNWDALFQSEVQIISHDASKFDFTNYPKYRNGKRIAWGIKKPEDVRDYQPGDLITLPCGMGLPTDTVAQAEANLEKLLTVSQRYR